MACQLSLFGSPRLLDDQGSLISVPAKTFVLIAYLVLGSRGGLATRSSLRQFLWDAPDSKAAASNLRKFLARITDRQTKGGFELIRSHRDHVELTDSVRIDLLEFLAIVAAPEAADLARICDVYCGDLLEGLELEEPECRDWVDTQRTNLRDAFVSAVASRLEDADEDKLSHRIAARRLVEVDPYNEPGHRTLMRLYAEDGEPARVQEFYRTLERRLRDDLNVEPGAKTTELYESLLPGADASGAEPDTFSPVWPSPRIEAPLPERTEDIRETLVPAPISGRSGTPRVTILPPNAPGAPDYHHQLAASLVEDITIGLCRFKALSVVAPHTAWQLSLNRKKAQQLRTFGIDYSVETKIVQSRDDEHNLSVKLIDAVSREIIWVDQYRMSPTHAARHYRDLSGRILSSIIEKLEHAELSRYDAEQEPTAYHLYLMGQKYIRTLDLPNVRRARRAFKQAVRVCEDFVPAISGLARTFQLEWLLMARGEPDLLDDAARFAGMAVSMDPDDARGYRELGVCNLYAGRFDESLQALAFAEERNPQFADLLMDHSDALLHSGDAGAALAKLGQAIEMNPLCPDTYWWAAGGANYQLHKYRDAVECLSRMRDQSAVYRLLAASWAMLGETDRARDFVRRTREIHPDFSVGGLLSHIPFRDPTYAKHYEHGLREAGFN
jgi:DNA-binding SARP family transcriptional activator/tetratricopeptide (TPR) repeat protein/TolB-like protein